MKTQDRLEELEQLIEGLEDIPAAEEFAESLREKHASFVEWYEVNGALTDPQEEALDNMIAGARRWFHD